MSKLSLSPPLVRGKRGIFLNLAQLLEAKLTKLEGPPKTGPPGVFISQTGPLGASSSLYRFDFCPRKLWFSGSACLSLQVLHQRFALWPPSTYRSKNCWFCSLFGFLLVLRMEWQLPRFPEFYLFLSKNSQHIHYVKKILEIFSGTKWSSLSTSAISNLTV